jgi:hypothetical protein
MHAPGFLVVHILFFMLAGLFFIIALARFMSKNSRRPVHLYIFTVRVYIPTNYAIRHSVENLVHN